jgi:excisionase family DNA binding protein
MSSAKTIPDVLTLEEVASYLRLSKETIERQASQGQIPGRRIEGTWRFLKAAIDDWLRSHDSRTILLQQAGALATDETLPQLHDTIYSERGRPEAEEAVHR